MANIRSREALAKSLRDWAFLNGSMGNMSPCDLDGIVEHRGHFLVLESKGDTAPSKGQKLLLEALARLPNFTVVVLYGDPIRALQQIGRHTESQGCTEQQVRDLCAAWYASAHA